jgi:hypothetical protein
MNRNISFGDLSHLLEGLQFERLEQPTHVLFEHAPSGTRVVLRPYTPREIVAPVDLASVRKALDERGLMLAESFDQFLRKKPA